MTGPSRRFEIVQQLAQARRRCHAELGVQQHPVALELPVGVRLVPLSHVDPYERSPGTLPQRLGPHRGRSGNGCLRQAVSVGESGRHRFEGVQAELVPVLSGDDGGTCQGR